MDLLPSAENDRLWYAINFEAQKIKASEAFLYLEKNGIQTILIKGIAAALNYPNYSRQFSDIDLCVAPADFEKAKKLIETDEGRRFNIDLHKGLRHLDKMSWEELFAGSRFLEIKGVRVRILSEEDHLRVMCVHWLNDGGEFKDRLYDIFYAVENRPDTFDWDRFLNSTGSRRRRWFVICLGIAHKYLGLNLEDTPIKSEARNIPLWITETIEREWQSDVRLYPLDAVLLRNRRMFWQQLKKRFPPNPIQATVEVEGDFDNKPRIFYQIADIFKRLVMSVKRFRRKS